ncbi:WD-40 repeat-containing protein [Reticulomyxa filosa]|uniref:WD-40 repeat-containing protein n=1 Tax=Reticulomyxa filosa TaxID=46433 RepID=X6M218_RETFI|nr:WD-40 repeat-containing protein [Reticulomyxa filosa]|eukprot:ETO07904.1 WD-40 repeat-containing protein [Reticulomyxa filosa]
MWWIDFKIIKFLIFFCLFKKVVDIGKKKIMYKHEEKIQLIIQYWIRILEIEFGWIHEFDKLVVSYIYTILQFDTFRLSSRLINTFNGHTSDVCSIYYSIFNNCQFINTVRVWDIDNNKQIQSFNGHSNHVNCVKFSQYHYHNHH